MAIYQDIMKRDDRISIITFNSCAHTLVPLQAKHELDLAHVLSGHTERSLRGKPSFRCSGNTALWDAVAIALEAVAERKQVCSSEPSHPYLLVLSDGEDNSSTKYVFDSRASTFFASTSWICDIEEHRCWMLTAGVLPQPFAACWSHPSSSLKATPLVISMHR
jgi:hypothetical protein